MNKRDFFNQYTCEILTSKSDNRDLISRFESNQLGKGLERYLRETAWEEDTDGETRVYLVKDTNDKVALFFSLKCGLLYEPQDYDRLEPEKQEFVGYFIDAIKKQDQEAIDNYYATEYYSMEEMERLYKIAQYRLDTKKEGEELGDDSTTLKVHRCYSGIELRHFCKNVNYDIVEQEVPIGFGLFWEVVVPKVLEITELVGCKYLYLFAADNSCLDQKQTKILVDYYKNDLMFSDIQDLMIIKPDYDKDCYGLLQEIADLKKNHEVIWDKFSDI